MIRSLLKRTKFHRAALPLLAMLLTTTTAWADVDPVKYIDADGSEKNCEDYTVLTGGETSLAAGWYVVNSNISYTGTINLTGDVHLILADNCTMNIGNSTSRYDGKGIENNIHALTIYGQSTGDHMGTLSIYTKDHNCIYAIALTVNGGHVIADADGWCVYALSSANAVTINGGIVEAAASGDNAVAIRAVDNFTYTGGNVTTAGSGNAICALNKQYSFTWRNATDYITIGSTGLYTKDGKSATFTKVFTDGSGNYYSGEVTDLSTLAGKTLKPAYKVIADVEHGTVVPDKSFVAADAEDKTVTLQVNPDAGYFIESLTATDANNNAVTITNNTFTMPASDVTLSATFTKTIASVIVGENETYYGSFSAAETAAKAAYVAMQGETAAVVPTLKLYDDVAYGENSLQIDNGTNAFEMTLDLNGHHFYGKGAQVGNIISNLIYIAPKAKLTVVDTSNGDTKGSIDCTKAYGQCIINCGTLNLNGGIVKYSGGQGFVVCNYDGGLLTLDGATIIGKPTSGTVYATGILNAFSSTCNIVSGSIEDCSTAIQNDKGDVNMSGGVITNCRYGIDLNHSKANTLIISGGTISNCSEEGIMLGSQGNLNMTAFPAFSGNTIDIAIYNEKKMKFCAGTYTAPTEKIKLKVDYSGTDPYAFTEGYSANVKNGNDVIAFNDVFNVTIQNQAENATLSFVGEAVIAGPKTFSFNENQVWSTWCDKYEWTIPEGIEVYEITGVSNRNVGIQQLSDAIPAYKPVLLKKKDSGSLEAKATIAGVGAAPESYNSRVGVVTNTVGDATLVGTIQDADLYYYYTSNKTYVLYNNEFLLIDSNNGLPAHKFWINLDINGADNNYKSRSLSIGGEGTTGINSVENIEFRDESWYSLDGRKLVGKPAKKGVYILNGEKIVIK